MHMLRGSTAEDKARENVDTLIQSIIAHLNKEQGIVDKKGNYNLLGCRGDWPELKPADWVPPEP